MSDETAMLIDCLRYRPVAVTAAQMREAAAAIDAAITKEPPRGP